MRPVRSPSGRVTLAKSSCTNSITPCGALNCTQFKLHTLHKCALHKCTAPYTAHRLHSTAHRLSFCALFCLKPWNAHHGLLPAQVGQHCRKTNKLTPGCFEAQHSLQSWHTSQIAQWLCILDHTYLQSHSSVFCRGTDIIIILTTLMLSPSSFLSEFSIQLKQLAEIVTSQHRSQGCAA